MPHKNSRIDADSKRIEPCEERLALSASLAADLLVETLNLDDSGAASDWNELQPEGEEVNLSPDLITQANDLRETHGLTGAGQTVAVIDTGVTADHVALGGGFGPGYRVVGGWDFAENDANPNDDGPTGFHGTHIAGLLAGDTDGFAGVAPEADIVALRVFDDYGFSQLEWIESSLQWVLENQNSFESPITTVNLSIGTALNDANRFHAMDLLEDELSLLRENNILVFAASGNSFDGSSSEILYPASSPSVIAVGSIDDSGLLSDFAQRESGIFAARGESIVSAVPDHVFGLDGNIDDFAELDGTSMATPQVAAASILVRQALIDQGIEPTADEILSRLSDNAATSVDPITGATFHTIDLDAAIESLGESPVPAQLSEFNGTNDGERVELDLRNGIQLRIGGVTYSLDESATEPLVIDVGGGNDSLRILGGTQAERLVIQPGLEATGSISTNEFEIELRGFENVTFEGGGGPDRATLFDSPGSDTLTSYPTRATLEGVGFQYDVIDVGRIFVHGTVGGTDTAFLHDGQGDDSLSVRPQFTSIRSDDAFQLAYGFERVYAYANAGGFDTAKLYDSVGDDTISISAGRSAISGPGYRVTARGFDTTEAIASGGGVDIARIYGDESGNQWRHSDDQVQWTGADGQVRVARNFERVEAFEQLEQIELEALSNLSSLQPASIVPWLFEDTEDRNERDAAATRSVFEQLGNQ